MYAIDKKEFGAFVARMRKEKGCTQKELAAKLYVSDKAVSKWETGASLPDTALLIPLADFLDVTVTELLLCRKSGGESLSCSEAEKAVQTAIEYGAPAGRVWQGNKKAALWYAAALVSAAVSCVVAGRFHLLDSSYLTYAGLIAFFGAYFCLFARQTLPGIYYQAPISFMSDGPVRMNLPGVHFNNRNWPHILRTAQTWAIASLGLFPWFNLALYLFGRAFLPAAAIHWILLIVVLGSLFIPLMIAGKKYE